MAITENYKSRTMHITANGVTVDVLMDMLWSDFNLGSDVSYTLPDIGDSISVLQLAGFLNRPDLRCTDIQTFTKESQLHCSIAYLFSTDSIDGRKEEEDQITSWDFHYESDMAIDTDDVYFAYTVGPIWTKKSWKEEWVDTYGGAAADTAPTFVRYRPKLDLVLSIFGSKLYNSKFQATFDGRVNSVSFYQYIFDTLDEAERIPIGSDRPETDVGEWLCMDANMDRVRYNCFNYTLRFRHNPDGWNKVRNATTGNMANRIVYPPHDFTELLEGMKLRLPEDYSRST